MNKNIKGLFVALAFTGLVLSGCSSDSKPASTVTVTEEAPAPEVVETDEQRYINNLRSFGNYYVDMNTDNDLINLGYTLCGSLDAGYTVEDLIYELSYGEFAQQNGGDEDAISFAGLTIGAAVRDLCPQYTYQIEALL